MNHNPLASIGIQDDSNLLSMFEIPKPKQELKPELKKSPDVRVEK